MRWVKDWLALGRLGNRAGSHRAGFSSMMATGVAVAVTLFSSLVSGPFFNFADLHEAAAT